MKNAIGKTSRGLKKFLAPVIALAVLSASLTLSIATFAEGLFSGGEGTEAVPYQISTPEDLAKLAEEVNNGNSYVGTYFELTKDIDLTDYLSETGAGYNSGKGWQPIWNKTNAFSGAFDGKNHQIAGLWSNRPALTAGNNADPENECIGLFGRISNATVKNLAIEIDNSNVDSTADPKPTTGLGITGSAYVGGLAGRAGGADACQVENCKVTAKVSDQSAIHSNRQATSNYAYAGGLIGENLATVNTCSASVILSGTHKSIGGLIGFVGRNAVVSKSYATGDVYTQMGSAGGFVGRMADQSCLIENCYSTGDVYANGGSNNGVGGFIGELQESYSTPKIINCYSTGNVTGMKASDTKVFGFCGYIHAPGKIDSAYGVFNSFFLQNSEVNNGLNACAAGNAQNTYYGNMVGIDTDSITAETFDGWDPTIWYLVDGQFPTFMQNITVTPKSGQSKVYDGNPANPASLEFEIFGAPDGFVLGGEAAFDGEAKSKGDYTILQGTINNVNNPGYNVTFTEGVTYSITGVQITVTPDSGQSKIYGESKEITYTVSGSLSGASFTGALALSSENAGIQKVVRGSLALTGGAADNYTVIFTENVDYTVNRKNVTVTPNAGQKKTFDGTTATDITYATEGLIGQDTLNGALALENAAVNKGNHNIVQGTLTNDNNPNYNIGFASAPVTYEIEAAAIVVKPTAGLGKDYDGETVTLSQPGDYSFTINGQQSELLEGYSLNIVLSLKDDATDIGSHEIVAKTLMINGPHPDNYTIVLSEEKVTYQIAEVSIKVTPNTGQNLVYGSDAPIAYTTDPTSLPDGVSLKGALSLSGNEVGQRAIEIGTLELDGSNAINYRLILTAGVEATVTPKPITVTPNAGQSKEYDGETADGITYTAEGLVGEDSLSGALALEENAVNAGEHKITAGTLANANYTITVADVSFKIVPKPITVTPNAGQSKEYDGKTADKITYTVEGLLDGDTLDGALALENNATDAGVHKIVIGTLANANYTITVADATYEIKNAESNNPDDNQGNGNQSGGNDDDNNQGNEPGNNDGNENGNGSENNGPQTGVPAATAAFLMLAISFAIILAFNKKKVIEKQ